MSDTHSHDLTPEEAQRLRQTLEMAFPEEDPDIPFPSESEIEAFLSGDADPDQEAAVLGAMQNSKAFRQTMLSLGRLESTFDDKSLQQKFRETSVGRVDMAPFRPEGKGDSGETDAPGFGGRLLSLFWNPVPAYALAAVLALLWFTSDGPAPEPGFSWIDAPSLSLRLDSQVPRGEEITPTRVKPEGDFVTLIPRVVVEPIAGVRYRLTLRDESGRTIKTSFPHRFFTFIADSAYPAWTLSTSKLPAGRYSLFVQFVNDAGEDLRDPDAATFEIP